jgi:hypothetical protein
MANSDKKLRRGEKVVNTEDLPGVPRGTAGRVLLVVGVTWLRYRVAFENGREIGTLDPSVLARRKDWEQSRRDEARAARLEARDNPIPAG